MQHLLVELDDDYIKRLDALATGPWHCSRDQAFEKIIGICKGECGSEFLEDYARKEPEKMKEYIKEQIKTFSEPFM